MTTTTATAPARTPSTTRSLLAAGALAGAGAAVATVAVAAAGHAAGISLNIAGEPIPIDGFAILTLAATVLGVALAVALARWARSPRATFVKATVALTALSFLPDAVADATSATKALLIVTHVVAAAIVIPALAARLSD